MYKIDQQGNKIEKLEEPSFSDLRLHERKNLQEWIAKEPTALGEELLIIQKEFADWEDTNERLDLLALDKQGSLVIIENKLDDSGKDVTWQALKYASYCSTLSKENIKKIYQDYLGPKEKAEEKLSEFFDDTDTTYEELSFITQRIILIAARFRKEVTSTVLWLMRFKIKIQCFRATPYSMDINGDKKLFLNFEQIIPPKDAEDYMIRMAEKEQDLSASQNHLEVMRVMRKKFWTELIQKMNNAGSDLYQGSSPQVHARLDKVSGLPRVFFRFAVSNSYGRAELYIDRGFGRTDSQDKKDNKLIFDELYKHKEQIDKEFDNTQLFWERLDNRRACRIKTEVIGNILNEKTWGTMQAFMVASMLKLEASFKDRLKQVEQKLRQ